MMRRREDRDIFRSMLEMLREQAAPNFKTQFEADEWLFKTLGIEPRHLFEAYSKARVVYNGDLSMFDPYRNIRDLTETVNDVLEWYKDYIPKSLRKKMAATAYGDMLAVDFLENVIDERYTTKMSDRVLCNIPHVGPTSQRQLNQCFHVWAGIRGHNINAVEPNRSYLYDIAAVNQFLTSNKEV